MEEKRVGDPCPMCQRPLVLRRSTAPRQGGRASFAYCPHDRAAWELKFEDQPVYARSARAR
jgi:hypothetical protein